MDSAIEIFPEKDTLLLKKYDRGIFISRVIILSFGSLCLFFVLVTWALVINKGSTSGTIAFIQFFGFVGLLYLLLGLMSIKYRFQSILILVIVTLLFLILELVSISEMLSDISVMVVFFFIMVFQLLIIGFGIRGLIFAKKRNAYLDQNRR